MENLINLFLDGDHLTKQGSRMEDLSICRGIGVKQAMNIAQMYTRSYNEVRLYDEEIEAFIEFTKHKKPTVECCYPESYEEVAKKYGLWVEEVDGMDQTDLEKEKWDNYWGDFDQCGVHWTY